MNLVNENDSILIQQTTLINLTTPQLDLFQLERDMATIVQEKRALGLAAPQIGIPYSVFYHGELKSLVVNPVIVCHSKTKTKMNEGCLSFPYLYVPVERWDTVTVTYFNAAGEEQKQELSGTASRCFQHELDHLHGITILDRTSKLSLDIAKRKRNKWFKKGNL